MRDLHHDRPHGPGSRLLRRAHGPPARPRRSWRTGSERCAARARPGTRDLLDRRNRGDLVDRISVSGEIDLAHSARAIGARLALTGVDRTAVVCSLTRVSSEDGRLDLSGEVGLVLHDGPAYRTNVDFTVANLTIEASRKAALRLRSASARVRFVPGRAPVLSELALEEPVVRFERLADRSLAVAGVVVAEPPCELAPPRASPGAALLDRLEAALVSSRASTALPGVSAEPTPGLLPELPDALTVRGGELYFPGGLAFLTFSIVERVLGSPGSAQLVASASAASPGVARSLDLGVSGLLTDRALAASLSVSVAGVTSLAFQGASTFTSGELDARAALTLHRETGNRVAGTLLVRDGRLADHGELRARVDHLDCSYSAELGAARPVVRVSRLEAEGVWTTLTRSATGDLLVAGIAAGGGREPCEPSIDFVCDRASLRGLGLRVGLGGGEAARVEDRRDARRDPRARLPGRAGGREPRAPWRRERARRGRSRSTGGSSRRSSRRRRSST